MKLSYRRHGRNALVIFFLLAAAGWLAPRFFSAESHRRRVEEGLKLALGRRVTFGAISLHLIPRPGFSVENAVIAEDPAFGAEPFARVDRIDCELRLRSLHGPRVEISRLSLDRPSFNAVRNAQGDWNVESLLSQNRTAPAAAGPARSLEVEMDDARLNFKILQDKKPLAITGVSARINFASGWRRVTFHLAGSPIRTDLAFPTPGPLELKGEWTPGGNFEGPLDATLETQGSMLYDWIPVVTGRTPEIYGLVDASAHLSGSFRDLVVEGRARLTQLHRWDQAPPSDTLDSRLNFRGRYDRAHGRLTLESADVAFANSRLHVTGSVDAVFASPEVDLVVAVERSRLEDFHTLAGRFTGGLEPWKTSGRVDALMTVQGPWAERRYSGFVQIRDARLATSTGTFPISEIVLRVDPRGARLAPVKVSLAPGVELLAEGSILPARSRAERGASRSFRYELSLSAKTAPLDDLLRLVRGVSVTTAQGLDAQGPASLAFHFSGPAWPLERPSISGHVDLHAARLLIPGLTEPLNLPKAHIEVRNSTITVNPVVAVMGTSVFTGRLEHQGERKQPWKFDARADGLSLEQASLWFDVLGHRAPVPLLARLPGLRSLAGRRAAASGIFTALNAEGRFASPKVTYRGLALHDFQATVRISGRVVRVNGATFKAGGGRGKGRVLVDLNHSPAQVVVDAGLEDSRLQFLAPYFPAKARKTRGSYSVRGHFETLGLSRGEMSANLQGQATVHLKNVSFGDFDPLQAMARATQERLLAPLGAEAGLPAAVLTLEVNDRRVVVTSAPAEFSGAKLRLNGTYSFDGNAELSVHADLRALTRRWSDAEDEAGPHPRRLTLRLAGPLNELAVEPVRELSRANP